MPFTSQDTTTISRTRSTVGSAKAQGPKAKPTKSGQSHLEHGTKWHKGCLAFGASDAPSRGPDILNLRIGIPTGRFPSRPSCGLASSCSGFSLGLLGKDAWNHLSQIWSGGGGGGVALCLILQRGTCPGWFSPLNGNIGSTQFLT
jgi:hypothetical protein